MADSAKPGAKPVNPIRETSDDAIRLAKTLVRTARHAALGVLDGETGHPFVSRVAVAPDLDGTPVLLVSRLAFHTKSLLADPRCSLLAGEPGKGDPLAHPRVTIECRARFLERDSAGEKRAAARFLRHNPKAGLYAGFADFNFVRLEPLSASLNGGFGQAYRLTGAQILSDTASLAGHDEESLLAAIHTGFAADIAGLLQKSVSQRPARIASLDSEGFDLLSAGQFHRYWWDTVNSTGLKSFNQKLK